MIRRFRFKAAAAALDVCSNQRRMAASGVFAEQTYTDRLYTVLSVNIRISNCISNVPTLTNYAIEHSHI